MAPDEHLDLYLRVDFSITQSKNTLHPLQPRLPSTSSAPPKGILFDVADRRNMKTGWSMLTVLFWVAVFTDFFHECVNIFPASCRLDSAITVLYQVTLDEGFLPLHCFEFNKGKGSVN